MRDLGKLKYFILMKTQTSLFLGHFRNARLKLNKRCLDKIFWDEVEKEQRIPEFIKQQYERQNAGEKKR